jgi:5S rRNA maturation endonuclease (ribonuclease M5)
LTLSEIGRFFIDIPTTFTELLKASTGYRKHNVGYCGGADTNGYCGGADMNEDNIRKLLACLGVTTGAASGEWYRASCPLAFHRHKAGKDSKPSFGIHIEPAGKSGFLCYSCQIRSRDLADLLWEIAYALKSPAHPPPPLNLKLAQEIIDAESVAEYAPTAWSPYPPPVQEFVELPGWWLDSFNKREVPPALWSDLELRYDTGRKMVAFPFYSISGKLAGMRGRSILPAGNYSHHDYAWNGNSNAKLTLFNENNIDWMKPVVVVEGEFDLCKVVQVYSNVVANLTATLSEPKLKTLEMAISIVGFFDNDEAGQRASQMMQSRFGYGYRAVDYDDLKVKDAGDMSLQQIQKVLAPHV